MSKISSSSSQNLSSGQINPEPIPPTDFIPWITFERMLSTWWLIVAAALVGGLTAWCIHLLQPQLFDATAILSGSINFTETGALPEYQLDYALDTLGAIIRSDEVQNEVIAKANAAGLDLGTYGYQPYLERKSTRWILRVRHPNPETAATLANYWVTIANEQVSAAYVHAQSAHQLNTYLTTLETCLTRAEVSTIDGVSCGPSAQAELQAAMVNTVNQLNTELQSSRGIPASLVFNLESEASVPTVPTRYGLNSMILSGGLIGLILGVWAIQIDLPTKFHHMVNRRKNGE